MRDEEIGDREALRRAWSEARYQHEQLRLFVSREGSFECLPEIMGLFWWTVFRALRQDVVLRIAKITDRRRVGENQNLTIHMLDDADEDMVRKAFQAAKPLRLVRNKFFAHHDRNIREATLEMETIDKAVDAISKVIWWADGPPSVYHTEIEWFAVKSKISLEALRSVGERGQAR